jgi:hypothetical protein
MEPIVTEKEYRERLQKAVRSVDAPPYLEARIRSQIRAREAERRSLWRSPWTLATAALAVAFGLTIAYQLGNLRFTRGMQESYISNVSYQVATLMRVGLGDHVHCAFFRKYPKNPPTTEQFVQKLGPDYSGLMPIVRKEIPESYRLDIAHQCTFHGRKFVHLVLRNDAQLLSVVIAKKQPGESFSTEGLIPALAQSDIPIYTSGVQRFQIASFESRDHLVYVISDLPKDQNTQMMVALAAPVKDFLKKLEL